MVQIYQGVAVQPILEQIQNELGPAARLHSIQQTEAGVINITADSALENRSQPASGLLSSLLAQKVQPDFAQSLAHSPNPSQALDQVLQTSKTKVALLAGCTVLLGADKAGKTSAMARLAWTEHQKGRANLRLVVADEAQKNDLAPFAKLLQADLQTIQQAAPHKSGERILVDANSAQIQKFQNAQYWLVLDTRQPELVAQTTTGYLNNLHGVFFTHLDSAKAYGLILNHALQFKLPVIGWSFGMRLSQTEIANGERLLNRLTLN